ncbi:MAG: metallopeptidase [Eubacterium sp.]|nr:metallopeptidase [Eubacterium sp.]
MKHVKTQTEWEYEMSVKILDLIRSELYLDLRFLDIALSALIPREDAALKAFATDGIYLKYSVSRTLCIFKDNPKFLGRAYLHSVLHCIFSHLWLAGNREQNLWNTACDIAVEYTIDCMDKPGTRRILTWNRQQMYNHLKNIPYGISAAVIYQLIEGFDEEHQLALQAEFYTDDHRYWPMQNQQQAAVQNAKDQWNKIARQVQIHQDQHGGDTTEGERLMEAQIKGGRSRRSYSSFLKKFSVLREELHCDPDEFDLNFYTYGLRLYKNMPLVEPVESREIRKIQEFVIVVDTSDSTSGSLVKNFLRETFHILHQRESFFAKCRIRLIQCDDQVRSDQLLEDLSHYDQLLDQFTIIGGGGTNFCPAFSYVEKLIHDGTIPRLDGLLYFTDGRGIYPKKRPSYQTAFLFLEDFDESKVPPWAMRLQLSAEEFISAGHFTRRTDTKQGRQI